MTARGDFRRSTDREKRGLRQAYTQKWIDYYLTRTPGLNDKLDAEDEDSEETGEAQALSFADLLKQERESEQTPMVIADMFPTQGISVVAGDSTIGKSALVLQMAACVAGGKPFLGKATQRGKVLVVDWENGNKIAGILTSVAKAAGVSESDLHANVTILKSPPASAVLDFVKQQKPAFITLDALRWLLGGKEKDTELVTKRFKQMTDAGSSWVLVHHLRKQSRDSEAPSLEDSDTRVVQWFQEVSGSLAITNQSFTRMGVVEPKRGADLLVRWVVKLQGERGPVYVERLLEDDDPEKPLGYAAAQGFALLTDSQKSKYVEVAGKTLTFAELLAVLGNKSAVTRLTRAWESAGLLTKVEVPGKQGMTATKYQFAPIPSGTPRPVTEADIPF